MSLNSSTNREMANELHVVMLPWPAFGHMMPFYQLAIALAKTGTKASFIATPRNIERLPKVPPNLSGLINLVKLPFPKLDNELLPEDAEATVDIPFSKIEQLKIAYDLLQHPVKEFVSEQSPDWLIADFATHWAAEIARECHVPLLNFSVFNAVTNVFAGPPEYLVGDGQKRTRSSPETLTIPPEWVPFPSSVALRIYEAIGFHAGFYGENASGTTDAERYAKVIDSCQAVAIRSCPEFESDYMDLFAKLIRKPVIPVGLLPPEKPAVGREVAHESWSRIFKWLDEQKPRSVVFVGFGSECKLTKDQIHGIAHGLELSELPFLWALRKPSWAIDDLDALPAGFIERTSGRGIMNIGWAPQSEILAHHAIGCSLFHSGWGSVIEALQFGHVLVVLPFIIDQPLNARLLVEKGLAIEVKRSEDGSASGIDIADSLRQAMVGEEKQQIRLRCREAAAVFGDERLHQDHYMAEFVRYLENGGGKTK